MRLIRLVYMEYSNEVVIEAKNLKKTYVVGETRVHALNGVDFSINRGEFCMVVGTSGSGKSTLLNMIAGLERPTKGQIIVAGEHIENKSEGQLVIFRQKHVGFIFQAYNLMPNMTALENVELPLTFQGVDKFAMHRPTQMSGGQQQRVGIARALVVKPEIIFADEPTGNLDTKTSMEVLKLMHNIARTKNQTIVMVTHDNYLASFGDKIIHIIDGKIINIEDNRENAERNFASLEENINNTEAMAIV